MRTVHVSSKDGDFVVPAFVAAHFPFFMLMIVCEIGVLALLRRGRSDGEKQYAPDIIDSPDKPLKSVSSSDQNEMLHAKPYRLVDAMSSIGAGMIQVASQIAVLVPLQLTQLTYIAVYNRVADPAWTLDESCWWRWVLAFAVFDC